MRKPEQRLWDKLRKAAAGRVRMERLENLVGVGRPDVDSLVGGSVMPIELKQVASWPARAATKVLGDKGLRQAQKNWHLDWRRWGGQSMIVVGVGDEVFGFSGTVADEINDYTTQQFKAAAMVVGLKPIVELLIGISERKSN